MLTWLGVGWQTAGSGRRAPLREVEAPAGIALHTCARDAWLLDGDPTPLVHALVARGFTPAEIDVRAHRAAVERLMSVAVGLDSAVQGEADVGRQVRAALGATSSPLAPVLDHVLARLLRQGRQEGWVRAGHGVGALAVRAVEGAETVGVVGAGLLGAQVTRALGARARTYNRTARPGTLPLSALTPTDTWIVTTSGPPGWFTPPEPYVRLIDLGHPAQARPDPRRTSLDALLASAHARLDPERLQAAETVVQAATDDAMRRLARAHGVWTPTVRLPRSC